MTEHHAHDQQNGDDEGENRPGRWKRHRNAFIATTLPLVVAGVEIAHEVWQWANGQ